LAIAESNFATQPTRIAIALNNLATLLKDTNRLAEAEPLMRRALEVFVKSLGAEHPNSQTVAENYAGLLMAKGLSQEQAIKAVAEVVAAAARAA